MHGAPDARRPACGRRDRKRTSPGSRRPVSVPGSRMRRAGEDTPTSPRPSPPLFIIPQAPGARSARLAFAPCGARGRRGRTAPAPPASPLPPSGERDRGMWARRLRYSLLSAGRYLYDARTTPCDARVTLQARATRACGTLDSAPATFQARATSHLSHLIPLNPGESRLELNVYPSRRVLRPAPGGANARAPRRDSRLSRGRRCPPRASPRDRAGHGRAGRRSRLGRARPALRGRASRRASP